MVAKGLLKKETAVKAQSNSQREQMTFVGYLIRERLIPPELLAQSLSEDFAMPLLDSTEVSLEKARQLLDRIDPELVRDSQILPLQQDDNSLMLAVADPTNPTINDIGFRFDVGVSLWVAEYDSLAELIDQLISKNLNLSATRPAQGAANGACSDDENSVVAFVDSILTRAVQGKASDIHFEPYENSYRIRFRTDGILYQIASPSGDLGLRLASRLKVMAGLDIAERRLPQDGRIQIRSADKKTLDFRVSTLPTLWGEKVVLRLFNSMNHDLQPEQLGFEDDQLAIYLNALKKPQGMILITGPTGSGKTITLYTGLNRLNHPSVNIATAEDPPELSLTGINQLQINNRSGLSFSVALRALLRQDPDILMVGEIRDLETAEIAVRAVQTGHRVLSTLHTNSAVETLDRLAHLGISNFNIATAVSLIIAQRLVRKLCSHCKTLQQLPRQALLDQGLASNASEDGLLFEAVGCELCIGGYRGRTGIYETLVITPELAGLLTGRANSRELLDLASEQGFRLLRTHALNKVMSGITSLAEINRVI